MDNWGVLFYNATTVLSLSLLGFSLLFGAIKFWSFSKEQKWYLYYLVFIFFIELCSKLLIANNKENLFLYPIYICGEFVLLSTMFIVGLKLSRSWFLLVGLIASFLLSESMYLWMTDQNISAGVGKVVSHLIIVCMIGFYFVQVLKTYERKHRNRFLVIYGCLFLYYSASIFLFLLFDQLSTMSIGNASLIWGMNNALSSVLYGVSSYTFIKS